MKIIIAISIFVITSTVFAETISIYEKAIEPKPAKTLDLLSKDRLYQIKSGIVKYRVKGNYEGTRILYFDDYGNKEMWIEDAQLFQGDKVYPARQMYLRTGNSSYMINLEKKTAVKTIRSDYGKDDLKNALKKGIPNASDQFAEQYASKIFKEKEILGTEEILGKTCEIVEGGFARGCVYKGIALKNEVSYGMGGMVAIQFEENAEISGEKFKLPDDIVVTGEVDHRKMMDSFFQPREEN